VRNYKIISWVAVILWMALIFNLSAQPAEQSADLSTRITKINIEVIKKVSPNTKFNILKLT
jgi:VanZ family protein